MPTSHKIVTIFLPLPIFLARLIAPATLIPEDDPRQSPSSFNKSNVTFNASMSLTWKASSIGAIPKFFEILEAPIPSVIDDPEDSNFPFFI